MPIYINYSSGSAIPNSVQFGNVYIANDDLQLSHSYGPTITTNWNTGIDYPNGGYTWYRYITGSTFNYANISSTVGGAPNRDDGVSIAGGTNPSFTQLNVGEDVASASLAEIRSSQTGVVNFKQGSVSGSYTITAATLINGANRDYTRLTVTPTAVSSGTYSTGGGGGTIILSKFSNAKLNIWVPGDDLELLTYYNRVQGTTFATSTEVKDEIDNDPNQYLDGEPDRDGMVLYYDFSNPATYVGSGSVVEDQSGEGNDGQLVNSPTFNSSPPYFTGFTSNQYVGVTNTNWADSIPTGNSERTILIAFRTPNAFTANYYHALHYGDATQDEAYGFAIWTNSGNGGIGNSNADGVLANHTWSGTFFADFALALNTDYVGVIRYRDTDSPRSTMWINGSFKTIGFGQGKTADYSINTGESTAPRVGNRISDPTEPLGTNGRVYSILFYDRFLSNDECNTIGEIVAKRHNISF